jgi:tRNA uridine 5-carbamoylmethylation protein Kti12
LTILQQVQSLNGGSLAGRSVKNLDWGARTLLFTRNVSLIELQRLKRQFIQMNKSKPLQGGEPAIIEAFLQYLSSTCI